MSKKKFRLQHVGFCMSCAKEVVNSDSFVIFADRNCQHTSCYETSESIRQLNLKQQEQYATK